MEHGGWRFGWQGALHGNDRTSTAIKELLPGQEQAICIISCICWWIAENDTMSFVPQPILTCGS